MTREERLWRAFPTGTLPVRGVSTTGNWTCVYVGASHEGLGDDRRVVEGRTHAIWRYATGWELTECLTGLKGEEPRWLARGGVDMGGPPERFCEMGDLLPDVDDPLTAFAVQRELYRLLGLSFRPVSADEMLERIGALREGK